jgi:mRNA interferase RelE/StbE
LAWQIEFDRRAQQELRKLDAAVQVRIAKYLRQRIAPLLDPRSLGAPLNGELKNLWRYRVGDYRLICDIRDSGLLILVVHVGHRKDVYDD